MFSCRWQHAGTHARTRSANNRGRPRATCAVVAAVAATQNTGSEIVARTTHQPGQTETTTRATTTARFLPTVSSRMAAAAATVLRTYCERTMERIRRHRVQHCGALRACALHLYYYLFIRHAESVGVLVCVCVARLRLVASRLERQPHVCVCVVSATRARAYARQQQQQPVSREFGSCALRSALVRSVSPASSRRTPRNRVCCACPRACLCVCNKSTHARAQPPKKTALRALGRGSCCRQRRRHRSPEQGVAATAHAHIYM